MSVEDVRERYATMRRTVIGDLFEGYISTAQSEDDWDVEGLHNALKSDYAADFPLQDWLDEGLDVDELEDRIIDGLASISEKKEVLVGEQQMRGFEKAVMLRALDHYWKEHLASMDYLRQSVNLRGYAQKNPAQEYKKESFVMFTSLLDTINTEIVKALSLVTINEQTKASEVEPQANKNVEYQHNEADEKSSNVNNKRKKIGRNEPCPCNSGKKYKHCHGR
jgi:preprotein translocase subunit SecA